MYHANTNQKKVGLAINIRKSRFQKIKNYNCDLMTKDSNGIVIIGNSTK